MQGFGNQLQLLENSLQTMLNAITLTQGQTQQIVETLRGGQQGSPALVEAYLATLKTQADFDRLRSSNINRILDGLSLPHTCSNTQAPAAQRNEVARARMR